jgi:hypothetical protein
MAGGVGKATRSPIQVDASSLVGKATDLTPAITELSKGFREGWITADEIHQRYGSRGIAEDKAKTAVAEQQTKEIGALGDLQIKAKQAMLSPEMVGLEMQAKKGSLEDQIKTQNTKKESADVIAKAEKLKYGQLLNDAMLGVPSAALEQEAMQFPQLLKIDKDPNTGVIANIDEVKAGIGRIQAYKSAMAGVQKFTDLIDSKPQRQTFQDKDGNTVTVEQPVFKGSMMAVPKEDLQALWEFQKRGGVALPSAEVQQSMSRMFGTPGQVTSPAAPAAPTVPAQQIAPQSQATTVGTTTPTGGTIVGVERNTSARPTEVESRANKFSSRMSMAEDQYTSFLKKGVDPTSTRLQAENSVLSSGIARVPVIGPAIVSKISPEVKEYHQAVQSFTSAMLRDESGAAIRDEERAEYERMLFPVAGDPPDVVANKARQRAGAIAALKQVASRQMDDASYEQHIEAISGRQFPAATSVRSGATPPPTGAPPTPAQLGEAAATATKPKGKPEPSAIPRYTSGQQIPANTEWAYIDGKLMRRKATQ